MYKFILKRDFKFEGPLKICDCTNIIQKQRCKTFRYFGTNTNLTVQIVCNWRRAANSTTIYKIKFGPIGASG